MRKKIRVLYFLDRLLWGGIQSLLVDWIKYIDRDRFEIELLILDDGKQYELEERLRNAGIVINKLEGIWLDNIWNYIVYLKSLHTFFKSHSYDVIHLNSGSKNCFVLYFAKRNSINIRIAHSHNIGYQTKSRFQQVVGNLLKPLMKKYATHYMACSYDAAVWMFGHRLAEKGKVIIMNNGIETKMFEYNENWRMKLRKELNIGNEFVIGCVGRLEAQKNHEFLIFIFSKILKNRPESKLLIIGCGSLEHFLKKKVVELGIENSVFFLGFKENRNEWLSAMDAFVLPSKYEGLGIVLIEAQAAGLPCFASLDVVPKEAKVTNLLRFISLTKTSTYWSREILSCETPDREGMSEIVKEMGYDIHQVVNELEKIYTQGKR